MSEPERSRSRSRKREKKDKKEKKAKKERRRLEEERARLEDERAYDEQAFRPSPPRVDRYVDDRRYEVEMRPAPKPRARSRFQSRSPRGPPRLPPWREAEDGWGRDRDFREPERAPPWRDDRRPSPPPPRGLGPPGPPGPPREGVLRVYNLPPLRTEEPLARWFEGFGRLAACMVDWDAPRRGQPLQAKVVFCDVRDALDCLAREAPVLGDRLVRVEMPDLPPQRPRDGPRFDRGPPRFRDGRGPPRQRRSPSPKPLTEEDKRLQVLAACTKQIQGLIGKLSAPGTTEEQKEAVHKMINSLKEKMATLKEPPKTKPKVAPTQTRSILDNRPTTLKLTGDIPADTLKELIAEVIPSEVEVSAPQDGFTLVNFADRFSADKVKESGRVPYAMQWATAAEWAAAAPGSSSSEAEQAEEAEEPAEPEPEAADDNAEDEEPELDPGEPEPAESTEA